MSNMMNILFAIAVLGGLGLVFGLILTITSKIFHVETDPRVAQVRDALPGANCAGCGYAGCDACADAIVAGKAPITACPVGGAAAAEKIGAIMGVEAAPAGKKLVATVACQGGVNCKDKFDYTGIKDCVAASTLTDGQKACRFACLGLGTCVKACPFGAITIDEKTGIAAVDEAKCQSCGKCVAACPKGVLSLQPAGQAVAVKCRETAVGNKVTSNCSKGCIGCGKCFAACKFEAITMVNHLPVINPDKCRECMMCAEACPTGAIAADWSKRQRAEIDQSVCVGCGMCKRNCQFGAIEGEIRQPHAVIEALCTGCGACADKCPKKCIAMKPRTMERKRVAPPAPAAPAKPQITPEMQAKIDAALKAKAEKEAAAKAQTGAQA